MECPSKRWNHWMRRSNVYRDGFNTPIVTCRVYLSIVLVGKKYFTWVPSPKVISIAKKSTDHNCERGSFVTTSGYATKANPAPVKREPKKILHQIQTWLNNHLPPNNPFIINHTLTRPYPGNVNWTSGGSYPSFYNW